MAEGDRNGVRQPYGDRRQEIVLIGQNMNRDLLTKMFDKALLKWNAAPPDGRSLMIHSPHGDLVRRTLLIAKITYSAV